MHTHAHNDSMKAIHPLNLYFYCEASTEKLRRIKNDYQERVNKAITNGKHDYAQLCIGVVEDIDVVLKSRVH